jgi:hypothetical protein
MTTTKKPAAPAKAENPKVLNVERKATETEDEAIARMSLRPSVQAALTVMDYNKAFGELSLNTLVSDLAEQCKKASSGDLSRAEAMLTAQAHTLDAIFNMLARRATHAEYLNQIDVQLRLALKAQSQCRATLETLAAIKNPQPVAFVKQANISQGPQQVNNGAVNLPTSTHAPARAEHSQNAPNKLLEHQHGERLDFGTASAASGADSALETVGAVNRTDNARR